MSTRRSLLIATGVVVLGAPFSLTAQQLGKIPRIGYLSGTGSSNEGNRLTLEAFRQGMRELGYNEGRTLAIEQRFADGNYQLLATLATELVHLKVDVIVTNGTPATAAAQKLTTAIPIVMFGVTDPVGSGFVTTLARPERNITGLTGILGDISPKHIEMLLDVGTKLVRIAVLVNPNNASHAGILKNIDTAARTAGVETIAFEARTPSEIDRTFILLSKAKPGAVIVVSDGFFAQQAAQIAELAVRNRLPSIASLRIYAESGFLMSYGHNIADGARRAATYVDKLLKGAKVSDLPVEQPTRFELLVNMKTANALGIKIPQSVLMRADRVIE